MNYLAITIFSIIAVIALWLSFIKPRTAFFLATFLCPWYGLDMDIGVRVTAFQIVLVSLMFVTLMRMFVRRDIVSRIRISQLFIFFIVFAVLWSLVQIPFLPESHVEGGIFRSPTYRAIFQILLFFLSISPVFIIPIVLNNKQDIIMMLKVFIYSVVVLAIVGWGQIIIWSMTGWNPIPLGWSSYMLTGNELHLREGIFSFFGLMIYRMNSFAGEPKNLGAVLAFALIIIQAIYLTNNKYMSLKLKYLWLFLCLSMIATWSTSAFYVWGLGTTSMLIFRYFMRSSSPTHRKSIMPFLLLIIFVIIFVVPLITYEEDTKYGDNSVLNLFYTRTVGRDVQIEDFDETIIEYLKHNPHKALLGVGIGNIHLYADSYINPDYLYYMANTPFTAKIGSLKLISDLGVFGLVLFVYWIWREFKLLDKLILYHFTSQSDIDLLQIILLLGGAAFVIFLALTYFAMFMYLLLGVCVSVKTFFSEQM